MAGKKRNAFEIKAPTKGQLLYDIHQLDSDRDQAMISLMYLTGCRVTELLSITRSQIEQRNIIGYDFMKITGVPVLKRRKSISRDIIIPLEKEKEFCKIVINYIETLEHDQKLFDISRQRAWQITNEEMGLYNHFFRHMRTTHLTSDYGFSGQELKHFFAWASSKTADSYTHLNLDDIARKMGR